MVSKHAASRPKFRPIPRIGTRGEGGWTLVEMVIVIGLVVIMAGIATISYGTAVTRSKEAVLKTNLFRMRDAIDQYFADHQEYPASLVSLVDAGYLRRVPEDPFTRSTATWRTELAEFDPTRPRSLPGVFDVRSGAPGLAIDGTAYADW